MTKKVKNLGALLDAVPTVHTAEAPPKPKAEPRTRKGQPEFRKGAVNLQLFMKPEAQMYLKIAALEKGMTLEEYCKTALNDALIASGKPTMAIRLKDE